MTTLGWLAFLVAAGVAAPARYLIDRWVQDRTAGTWPWGTMLVNVTGCFLAGALLGLSLHHGLDGQTLTVVGTGGLGSYTTFSTMSFETVRLAEEGRMAGAVANAAGSLLAGAAAAAAGVALTAVS